MMGQSDAGWPIRQRELETATSNVAGRCIGDNSSNTNNSGYCLDAATGRVLDSGMVLRGSDMPDIRRLKADGDGEKGQVDVFADCSVERHTAKWKKVGRKGESERKGKRCFKSRQANATPSNSARTRTGHAAHPLKQHPSTHDKHKIASTPRFLGAPVTAGQRGK